MKLVRAPAGARAVDWSSYAAVYDRMAEMNPAYQDLLDSYRHFIVQQWLHPGDLLLDLGAGTGNFSLVAADEWPHCRVLHIDANEEMNAQARTKGQALGLTNIDVRCQDIAELDLPADSVASISMVHTLYALPDPQDVIRRMMHWLQPGGTVFACDPGRPLDMAEWGRYLFRNACAEHGFWRAAGLFWRCRKALTQNRRISESQRSDRFWLHDAAAFTRAFVDAGFEVESCRSVYRGVSDLIVARKAIPLSPLSQHREPVVQVPI